MWEPPCVDRASPRWSSFNCDLWQNGTASSTPAASLTADHSFISAKSAVWGRIKPFSGYIPSCYSTLCSLRSFPLVSTPTFTWRYLLIDESRDLCKREVDAALKCCPAATKQVEKKIQNKNEFQIKHKPCTTQTGPQGHWAGATF